MRHDEFDGAESHHARCHYGPSRVHFRGPRRDLDQPYLAFIGGTETYGKFIQTPLPALVERDIGQVCVNMGCVNGGVDAFVNDPGLMAICADAQLTVVQIMGANNLSNRFYSVHPRRNDRFLRASTIMRAIFPGVDFSEFAFTRHMLTTLHAASPERFDIVVAELREAWSARMRNMLRQIGPRAILLWFSREPLTDAAWSMHPARLSVDPLFITASMVNDLRPLVMDIVVAQPSQPALAAGAQGMHYTPIEAKAASEMLGLRCHAEAAEKLSAVVKPLLRDAA